MTIDEVWTLHRRWSVVATVTAARLDRWRRVNLVLVLVGAALAALAAQQDWFDATVSRVLGAAGAGALAIAGVVQSRLLTAERVRRRVGARATSEAFKALTYQYLSGVAPQGASGVDTDLDRDQALAARVALVEKRSRDDAALLIGVTTDDRKLPAVRGLADYVTERAEGQRAWHEQRTGRHRTLARRWRLAELTATGVAAVLAAIGASLGEGGADLSAWVGVATTAGTAIAAHLAAQQHDRIVDSYARTVLDLGALLRGFDPDTATADQAGDFVAAVEGVLAAQNEAWVGLFSAR